MIQRIQSIFLLLVVICMGLTFAFPTWEKTKDDRKQTMTLMGLDDQKGDEHTIQNTYYLPAIAGLIAVVALASIFMFNNRMRQMQLGMVNSILMAVLLGLVIWRILEANNIMPGDAIYHVSFWAIVVAMLTNLAANRSIRKDENLVRAADRIR